MPVKVSRRCTALSGIRLDRPHAPQYQCHDPATRTPQHEHTPRHCRPGRDRRSLWPHPMDHQAMDRTRRLPGQPATGRHLDNQPKPYRPVAHGPDGKALSPPRGTAQSPHPWPAPRDCRGTGQGNRGAGLGEPYAVWYQDTAQRVERKAGTFTIMPLMSLGKRAISTTYRRPRIMPSLPTECSRSDRPCCSARGRLDVRINEPGRGPGQMGKGVAPALGLGILSPQISPQKGHMP